MKDFILNKVLGFIGGKLNGYKTKIGGIGLILMGIIGFIGIMYPDQGLPKMAAGEAITYITGGMVALGIGGKFEKQTTAINEQTKVIEATATPCKDTSGEGLS